MFVNTRGHNTLVRTVLDINQVWSKIRIVFKEEILFWNFFFRFSKNLIKTLKFEIFKRNTSFYFTFRIKKINPFLIVYIFHKYVYIYERRVKI